MKPDVKENQNEHLHPKKPVDWRFGRKHSRSSRATLLLPAKQVQAQGLTVEDVLFDLDNPVLGNPDGDVTVVEFFDYQCLYCRANHTELIDVVAEDGNVRLVMKDWPIFGPASIRASQLALGAVHVGAYLMWIHARSPA